MPDTPPAGAPRMRADAARNAQRIVAAATEVWAELGPDAPLEEIARRAGVGVATLYRRFATKDDLVRACLEQAIDEELEPAVARAVDDPDPWRAAATTLEAALAMVARHRSTLAAARHPEAIAQRLQAPLVDPLWTVIARAQQEGAMRQDLEPRDVSSLISMVRSTMAPGRAGEGWRRYLALILDALRPEAAGPLPPAT